jgi:hypothetical protein
MYSKTGTRLQRQTNSLNQMIVEENLSSIIHRMMKIIQVKKWGQTELMNQKSSRTQVRVAVAPAWNVNVVDIPNVIICILLLHLPWDFCISPEKSYTSNWEGLNDKSKLKFYNLLYVTHGLYIVRTFFVKLKTNGHLSLCLATVTGEVTVVPF